MDCETAKVKKFVTVEEFAKEFEDAYSNWDGDEVLQGLLILRMYTARVIAGSGENIIYSAKIADLINSGITLKDVKRLAKLTWFIKEDEYLACYV